MGFRGKVDEKIRMFGWRMQMPKLTMSVFEQHKAALAAVIAAHGVSDAFLLDHAICARLAALTDPRGSKVCMI